MTPDNPVSRAQPVRLQLSRRKGFYLQAHSFATNGLAAVSVARPSKWGNPYKVAPAYQDDFCKFPEITAATAVSLYREAWTARLANWPTTRETLAELAGLNLACWCAPDAPCHADVLLRLATEIAPSRASGGDQ